MALAYVTAALEMLADKFSLYLHVKGLSFAFPLLSMELSTLFSVRIRFYRHKTAEKNSGFVWSMAV